MGITEGLEVIGTVQTLRTIFAGALRVPVHPPECVQELGRLTVPEHRITVRTVLWGSRRSGERVRVGQDGDGEWDGAAGRERRRLAACWL